MSLRAEESAKQSLTRALSSENDIHNGIVVSSGCVFAIAKLKDIKVCNRYLSRLGHRTYKYVLRLSARKVSRGTFLNPLN